MLTRSVVRRRVALGPWLLEQPDILYNVVEVLVMPSSIHYMLDCSLGVPSSTVAALMCTCRGLHGMRELRARWVQLTTTCMSDDSTTTAEPPCGAWPRLQTPDRRPGRSACAVRFWAALCASGRRPNCMRSNVLSDPHGHGDLAGVGGLSIYCSSVLRSLYPPPPIYLPGADLGIAIGTDPL